MSTGYVRPFVEEDVSAVADLHRRVFGLSDEWSIESHQRYFHEVFLNNPWYDKNLCSLVYQEEDGKIGGFLGIVPRPLRMRGRPIRAAVSSQFVVAPESRFKLAGVQLLREFLSGPQDLSLADEANDPSRGMWERLGGSTALLYSIHWLCVLRPARYFQLRCAQRRVLAPFARLSTPISQSVDSLVARRSHDPIYRTISRAVEDPGVETLLRCSEACRPPESLRPEYDPASFEWLLERSGRTSGPSNIQKAIVTSETGEPIGWFLYYLDPRAIGEVVHIQAKKTAVREVLQQLFHHAWRSGAIALRGRLEPGLMPELLSWRGLTHRQRYWTLVHSGDRQLLDVFHRGEAFLTRLDGEWCLRFQKG